MSSLNVGFMCGLVQRFKQDYNRANKKRERRNLPLYTEDEYDILKEQYYIK